MADQRQSQISAADVEKYIGGIDFPVDKDELISHAKQKGAPKEMLEFMNEFPDQEYDSAIDVSKSVSQRKH